MRYLRRIGIILIMILFICTMAGCSFDNIPLTEKESDEIAEYMAYLYLKNDKNYTQKLVTPTPTPTPKPTKAPTATPTPEPENNTEGDGTNPAEITISTTPTPVDPMAQSNADYAQIIGLRDLEIEFVGYELRDNYYGNHYEINSDESAKPEVLSFSIEATDKSKQLLMVSFNLKSSKKSKREIDLRNSDIKYQLDINTGLITKPLLTLFDNDLQYLDIEMEAKGSENGVIVFEVPKDINLEKVYLMITKENKTAIIKII